MTVDDRTRWKGKGSNTSRLQRLQQRQQVLVAIREDLYGENFLEVETPLLVKTTCPDAHIDSIQAGDGYLVTSTEYQIKRLMVGGFEKVFTLSKNFRANEHGRYHSAEFTMLEWARANDTLHAIEEDAIRFIRKAIQKLFPNKNKLHFNEFEIEINKPWERLTVRKAFQKHLGLENLNDFSLESLCQACKSAGVELPHPFHQDKHLAISYLLDMLQPHLGNNSPTFLQEWPAYLTASAPLSAEDPHIAERSELYIGGIEIANGFPFLRNPGKQRMLFKEALETRKSQGKPLVAIDDRYINALELGLPQGAGMALGVDRLVMVLTDASALSDVQAFDWDEL